MYEGGGENNRLTDEWLSLILELETRKDDFATLREKVVVDREAMEAEFDASGDTFFNYGYGCCVFTHNICRSKPQIQDGMSDPSVPLTPEFFANPCFPPSTSSTAPASDPAAVGREECLGNSPTAAGEGATLLMDLPASSDGAIKDAAGNLGLSALGDETCTVQCFCTKQFTSLSLSSLLFV